MRVRQGGARSGVRLSSTGAVAGAIRGADRIDFSVYTIRRDNPVVKALEAAATGGARVTVRIGEPYRDGSGDIAATNRATTRDLEQSGVRVIASDRIEHLKAAVVDDRLYLDGRNWTRSGRDTVVCDERPRDVAAVRHAIERGTPARSGSDFAVGKNDALDLERALVAHTRRGRIDVESEVVTSNSRIFDELVFATRRHAHVRLVVSSDGLFSDGEPAALRQLSRVGVDVRVADGRSGAGGEKFCVTGRHAWVGSANLDYGGAGRGMLDWGLRTDAGAIARSLHDRFTVDWASSTPSPFRP
jgi:phosphatidylserine/phosphatidylglycerophosphate/cardiolipin synthase-like enzyme